MQLFMNYEAMIRKEFLGGINRYFLLSGSKVVARAKKEGLS